MGEVISCVASELCQCTFLPVQVQLPGNHSLYGVYLSCTFTGYTHTLTHLPLPSPYTYTPTPPPFPTHPGVPIVHLITYPFPHVWHTVNDNANAIDKTFVSNFRKILAVFLHEYFHLRWIARSIQKVCKVTHPHQLCTICMTTMYKRMTLLKSFSLLGNYYRGTGPACCCCACTTMISYRRRCFEKMYTYKMNVEAQLLTHTYQWGQLESTKTAHKVGKMDIHCEG